MTLSPPTDYFKNLEKPRGVCLEHECGEVSVRAIINLALTKGFVGREGCGLMPIRGHSGVNGGANV